MRQLLLNIKEKLKSVDGVRDSDIFISPDPGIVPETVKFPCIGIKDGQVRIKDLFSFACEYKLPVEIAVYENLTRSGDDDVLSILEKAEAVNALLSENYFFGYVKEVSAQAETPVQVLYKKQEIILRKTLSYEYLKEV